MIARLTPVPVLCALFPVNTRDAQFDAVAKKWKAPENDSETGLDRVKRMVSIE